jgi:hypothetical protein
VAGVLACVSGALTIAMAIFIAATGSNINCTYYTDDSSSQYSSDSCRTTAAMAAGLGVTGGLSWIACGVCTFVFCCGHRYKKYHLDDEGENNEGSDNGKTSGSPKTIVSTYPIASPVPKIHPNEDTEVSSTMSNETAIKKIITHLPDGSIKTEIESMLPNGKKQVTTTIEKPATKKGRKKSYVDNV